MRIVEELDKMSKLPVQIAIACGYKHRRLHGAQGSGPCGFPADRSIVKKWDGKELAKLERSLKRLYRELRDRAKRSLSFLA